MERSKMIMKNTVLLVISLLILLAIGGSAAAGGASSADTGVRTNVYFCKMIKVNNTYEFEPLLTLYTGENDYGRLTFVAGAENLIRGDYALVQNTPKGLELIQTLLIEPTGSMTPEYVLLNLELTKDQLPVPLEILNEPTPSGTSAPLVTDSVTPAGSMVPKTALPAATKSPASPLTALICLLITGILCAMRVHR
jgi:hypothetical protein